MGVRYWNCCSGGAGNVWLNEGTDPATPLVVWSLGPIPCSPDAYGTGLALVVAREMGISAEDPRLRKGVAWLKGNQRESGKWFTRSPTKDSKNYFTNFGCAFAVLGLQSCGELPGWPFDK